MNVVRLSRQDHALLCARFADVLFGKLTTPF